MAFLAVAVAGFTLATKDHDSPEDKIKLAKSARLEPQTMLAADNSSAGSSGQPADLQALADHIQAAAPSAVLPHNASSANTTAADSIAQAAPQQAQPQSKQSPQQTNPAQAADNQPKVDESALRYFASRGDKARLQAEISRLQTLYPNWTPPADPLAIPQNSDKQLEAMWQFYSEGRYAEVRKAIADRQTTESGWQPPADLLERLDIAEARTRLVNASDLKQYQTVIDIGARTPSLLTCSDIDVLWRVAEAFIRTDRAARGQDAYKYILKTCTNPQERLATIQKAAEVDGARFKPVQLPGTLTFSAKTVSTIVMSSNVAGLIPGSDPTLGKEVVVLSAHLDLDQVGALGHVNAASGLGDWPQGKALMADFIASLQPQGAA